MTIVAVRRCTLIGLVKEKRRLLEELQALGCLHIESLRQSQDQPTHGEGTRYWQAFKFLACSLRKLRELQLTPDFDAESFTERCLALEKRMRSWQDRGDFLRARIRALQPWGEFQLPPEEALAGLKLWFYVVPVRKLKSLPKTDLVWQVVHQTPRLAYLVVLAAEEPSPEIWPLPRVHTGRLPLSRLKAELARLMAELEDCELERERLTRWLGWFRCHLGELEDQALRRQAEHWTLDQDGLFALLGWVAVSDCAKLAEFAHTRQLGLILEDPKPDDLPPTLLVNRWPFPAGERLVRFYQIPRYDDWDPSAAVFVAFVAFFAIMLADAGYALLLALGIGIAWRRLGPDMKTLGLAAALSALVWGVLVGGYFGFSPPPMLASFKILRLDDFAIMLPLSLGLGLLHLSLANLVKAARNWRLGRPWLAPLGWVMAAWGGFGLWYSEAMPKLWLALLALGLGSVFVTGGRRPVKRLSDGFWRVVEGLGAITKATRLFGDVLSYLRLFAIALAGSSLAATCNALASQVHGVVGLGVLESLLVLLLGHGINFALSLMGAVIHGLRLNCIEFFGWALEGEGRAFQAFAKHRGKRWTA